MCLAVLLALAAGPLAADTVVNTVTGLTVPRYGHNGCCNVVFGPAGGTPAGTGGNWGYGVGSETRYGGSEGAMGYTGTHFIGIADAGLGPGSGRNDAHDYHATVGLNDGSGWHGFTSHANGSASVPSDFTRYDYASGAVEFETALYAHPSGLDVQIAHKFFFHYPVLRVWARMTNNTASPISVDVYYGGNLGSDGGLSQLIADSGGNRNFDPTDWWTLTDDRDGGGDSSLLHVWQQASLPFPFSVDSNNVDNHYLRTGNGSSPAVTVSPGETVHLLFFEEMARFRATLLDHVQTQGWYDDLASLQAQDFLSRIPPGTTFANWGILPGTGCADAADIDYQGLTAADCSRSTVTVTDQAGLDAYLADFAVANGKAKNLTVKFNPGGDVLIVSPCRVKVLGVSNLIDVSGGRVCVYGRKEVVFGAGLPAAGSAVDAGGDEILLVSEEGRVLTKPGIAFTAAEMTVEALKTAQIGTDSTLLIDGALTVTSDGTKASSHAFIDPRTLVDAASLTMTADKVVAIRNDAAVASGGDVTLSSTGASTASKAKIGDRAVVVAAGDVSLTGVKALIGDNAQVEAAGAVTLAAAGSTTASDATIEIGAEVMAASLSQTAEHKATVLKNTVLDVTGTCTIDADDPALCSVSALATILAGGTSGNCLP